MKGIFVKKIINPLRAQIDSMSEQAEAMLEEAQKQNKNKIANQIQEILDDLSKLSENEESLINEELYNDVYSNIDDDDDDW